MTAFSQNVFKITIIYSIIFLALPTVIGAGEIEKNGLKGITASIQGEQSDFLFPIWIGENFAVIPGISFVHWSDFARDVSFGIGIRGALKQGKSIPYLGARYTALIFDPLRRASSTDHIVNVNIGGEHFLNINFSFGVEAQLNAAISNGVSNRFYHNRGTTIYTSSAVMARFYFK